MIRASTVARACYIRPSLLRPIAEFASVLDRCAAMGFQTAVLPCPFVGDAQWQQAHMVDPDRLAAVFAWQGDAITGLSKLVEAGRERGLDIVLDLRLDEVAADAPVAARQPHWFRPHRAIAGDLPDPRRPPRPPTAAIARFDQAPDELIDWWSQTLARWSHAGIAGYRCLWPQQVPADSWHELISAVRSSDDARFWAWTPGIGAQEMSALTGCGFDAAFSSLAWWDFRAHWYLEEDTRLRRFAGSIAAIDDPFALPALDADPQAHCRQRIRSIQFGAATSDGVLVALDADDASDRAIAEANAAFATRLPKPRKGLRPLLTGPPGPVQALLAEYPGDEAHLVLVNADASHIAAVIAASLLRDAGENAALETRFPSHGEPVEADAAIELEPAEVRLYTADQHRQVQIPDRALPSVATAVVAPRIAIERVAPIVDGGRFAARQVVGDRVVVSADLLCDGHDLLHGAVLWRPSDESRWRRATMRNLGNDRWCGGFTIDRVGRHEFTIETWLDEFATARMDLEVKRLAGKLIPLDVREACQLVADAALAADDHELEVLASRLDTASDDGQRAELLVSPQMSQVMARSGPRRFLTRCAAVYSLEAERRGAGFGSWYELFPRSMGTVGTDGIQRHGNFDDVIARLPAIRDMGFDVLYMPPIHPIGRINRKGRNNAVTAQPGEPGSPYAIGASEGGHDAIHPELGSLEDFRRLVAAATAHGLEVALDFAIQCSPDHPWLREHPDWFSWRSDGSIRYAENPPKKYEDIVNVDFYADGAIPALWLALRDVVAFWVDEGIRLFRVDNPHTKPFPFWEWMIGDIRGRHPDVVFLSEAFTRPRLMHRLAKLGFSQSYTYFTWRNTKRELTDYLDELAHGEGRDYFRPHFFVNTPDINPVFLQHCGRTGHLIRAALATTLSGLWGMYSGFELCDATALPGKEEYLDSEKYQLRSWDWQRPGNIVGEITRLNLLRRLNPALQTHLGITFYNAFNDRILYYGKRRNEDEPMILVAVNLDPHAVQEADFELPLWEFGLPDDAALEVHDLWHGTRSVWRGKHQHLRLDPARLPFSIWRVDPPGAPA